MTRKILYSPGFGAGWTTWVHEQPAKDYMLTYAPIVEFIEGGGEFGRDESDHPLLVTLKAECKEKFGAEYVCVLGASDLAVLSVEGRVRIEEYDGSESVEEEGEYEG